MKVNISEAIRRSGVARATFYKMMKEGEISTSNNSKGKKVVDTSELIRVFGELKAEKKSPSDLADSVQMNSSLNTELDMLRQKIEFTERLLKEKTVQLEETKDRESKANERVDQLMRLLENKPSTGQSPGQPTPEPTPEPTSAPENGLIGLLKRVLG